SVAAVVTGAGGEPRLRVEPAGVDLATATVGAMGERRALDVRNIGDVPTEVVTLDLQGRSPTEFAITAESCTGRALNPGATCAVELEFRPDVASRRTATVVATTVTGEYAAAIVSGMGRHDPEVHVAADAVLAGGMLGVGLAGFPADADVTLSFDHSSRRVAVVRTDATGGLLVEVAIPRRTRPGERTLVATARGGLVATTELEVERRAAPPPVGVPGQGFG
ncbi:MAG: choice-of-anchor D domain-containing protein, partial [Ilumatobacteraceae bacterium]